MSLRFAIDFNSIAFLKSFRMENVGSCFSHHYYDISFSVGSYPNRTDVPIVHKHNLSISQDFSLKIHLTPSTLYRLLGVWFQITVKWKWRFFIQWKFSNHRTAKEKKWTILDNKASERSLSWMIDIRSSFTNDGYFWTTQKGKSHLTTIRVHHAMHLRWNSLLWSQIKFQFPKPFVFNRGK